MTAEEWLRIQPQTTKVFVVEIRSQKENGTRPLPGDALVDKSYMFTQKERSDLLNKIASLVDENITGRSDMCKQFSLLLHKSLQFLGNMHGL